MFSLASILAMVLAAPQLEMPDLDSERINVDILVGTAASESNMYGLRDATFVCVYSTCSAASYQIVQSARSSQLFSITTYPWFHPIIVAF